MDERLTLADGRWFLQSDVDGEWPAEDVQTFERRRLLHVNGKEASFYILEIWDPFGLITTDGPERHRLASRDIVTEEEAARWLMQHIPDVRGDQLPDSLRKAVNSLRL